MLTLPVGLRTKVIILSLFLLCLPWLGYQYVWEMEKYLRYGQEKTLEGTTQALATALHERPKLFNQQASFLSQVQKGRYLYAYPLHGPIQLDGKLEDWSDYQHRVIPYGREHRLYQRNKNDNDSIGFRHMVGKYGGYLYAFFEVTDPQVLYRSKNSLRIDKNDFLAIATQAPDATFRRYSVVASQDGWFSAFELPLTPELHTPVTPQNKIQGQWRQTSQGYNIELRIPLGMLGSKLGFAINDVNRPRPIRGVRSKYLDRQLDAIVGTSALTSVAQLGTVLVPSPEIEQIIKGMGHNSSRIWVVDNHGRVLAKSGDIRNSNKAWSDSTVDAEATTAWGRFNNTYLRPLYYKILTKPPKDFIDALQDSAELEGRHIKHALSGNNASSWRLTPDNKAVILAAASPIWINEKVMGVVIAEETTHGIRTLRNTALEKLFNVILTVMGMGTLALFIFASSISNRIRALRDDAENAIDSQGRVTQTLTPSRHRDEIGDLSRSFASIVSRLGQYTHYLENMSSRLSHELRTPVAVVRSSLEHLGLQSLPEDSQKYVDRAQEGVDRLNMILNNMSEATRLEESLSHAESSEFPLTKVVHGCIQGYQITYPQQQFALTLPDSELPMLGVPEYIAQLMDKLIANAIEFSDKDHAITVALQLDSKSHAVLTIANIGPSLPQDMAEQIFESMVSVRPSQAQAKPHLGLGLFIARLIVDYHHGSIIARNKLNESQQQVGVEIEITIPLISRN